MRNIAWVIGLFLAVMLAYYMTEAVTPDREDPITKKSRELCESEIRECTEVVSRGGCYPICPPENW